MNSRSLSGQLGFLLLSGGTFMAGCESRAEEPKPPPSSEVRGSATGAEATEDSADQFLLAYLNGPSIESSQVDRLLKSGANPNAIQVHGVSGGARNSALILAAMNIKEKDQVRPVLDALIEAGADVNYQNANGAYAVQIGIFYQALNDANSVEVLQALLDHGADPNLVTSNGGNLLTTALLCPGCKELVPIVLDAGGDVDVKLRGKTALAISVSACPSVSDLILERGGTADPFFRRKDKTTLETAELEAELSPSFAKSKTFAYLKKRAASKTP